MIKPSARKLGKARAAAAEYVAKEPWLAEWDAKGRHDMVAKVTDDMDKICDFLFGSVGEEWAGKLIEEARS